MAKYYNILTNPKIAEFVFTHDQIRRMPDSVTYFHHVLCTAISGARVFRLGNCNEARYHGAFSFSMLQMKRIFAVNG